MYVLGLDFETTGVDTKKDLVTEVGLVLWDTDRGSPVMIEDYYVNWTEMFPNFEISAEITEKTGIQTVDCVRFGVPPGTGLGRIRFLMKYATAVVAHNGTVFDKLLHDEWNRTMQLTDYGEPLPWVDTMVDLDYPEDVTTRKLSYLACEHGFLNPFPHRAVFDVLTTLRIMSQYDIEKVLFSASQPTMILQAIVSYDQKDLAKERNFRWDADNKRWIKTVKMHKIAAECTDLPFKTRVLAT